MVPLFRGSSCRQRLRCLICKLSTFDVFVREDVARLWEECLVSQKKYVLVLGNPGIGKSYSMLYLLRLLLLMPLQAPAAAHGADAMTAVPSDEMPASSTMMAVDTDAARGGGISLPSCCRGRLTWGWRCGWRFFPRFLPVLRALLRDRRLESPDVSGLYPW